jgi:alpha-ketoglutarate-dependent taurine dioxygenase
MTTLRDTPTIVVRPVAGHTGADISGVDISRPLAPETVRQLKDALYTFKVIFFRDQHLDHASQIAFGRLFGPLTYAHPHDEAPPDGYAEIFTVDRRRHEKRYGAEYRQQARRQQHSYFTGWHTDVTAAVNPPAVSILRADVVPDVGGDTQWTSLQAAYEGLSPALRSFADGLRAEHRYGGPDSGLPANSKLRKRIEDNLLAAIHPVVRVHPVTQAKVLFVNPGFTSHIVDLSGRESRVILDLLYAEITRPAYTVRFRWEPGSVAVWDNRATSHLAPADIDHLDPRRTLYRVTVIGDVPVGPDGRESELVAGKPFTGKHAVAVDD